MQIWCDFMSPSHYPLLLSIAVNFILNKQSPALSSLVDCPMLFGIDGLQECSQ
jgi:hypothetical protein